MLCPLQICITLSITNNIYIRWMYPIPTQMLGRVMSSLCSLFLIQFQITRRNSSEMACLIPLTIIPNPTRGPTLLAPNVTLPLTGKLSRRIHFIIWCGECCPISSFYAVLHPTPTKTSYTNLVVIMITVYVIYIELGLPIVHMASVLHHTLGWNNGNRLCASTKLYNIGLKNIGHLAMINKKSAQSIFTT